ncbi:MAG: hypothetical protein AB7O65_08070, partial [Candidatus Korobacteraceae bacterium]
EFRTPAGERKTLGAVEYVRRLEEVLIRTCAEFGVAAKRVPAAPECGPTNQHRRRWRRSVSTFRGQLRPMVSR